MIQSLKQSRSLDYNRKLKQFLPGGVHYNFHVPWEETPLHFVKGEGSFLWDMDGNKYLDYYAKFGAMLLGHNNVEYNTELKKWVDKISAVNHCDIDVEVCELLSHYIPSAEQVRFGLSGTEVVLNALRLARAYTGKNKFIRFDGHYHGNADPILGGKSVDESYTPVEYKSDYRGTKGREDIAFQNSFLIPWNDIDVLEKLVKERHEEIAAIMMEPICINGGAVMPREGYLQQVRTLCDKYSIVLIFDEVITGFRVGLGGAQELLGVTPDITTLGKGASGGALPVSIIAGKKELMDLYTNKSVIHAGTFNGYPLGLAAVKTTIDLLAKDNQARYKLMESNADKIYSIFKSAAQSQGVPLVVQGPLTASCFHCQDELLSDPAGLKMETMLRNIIMNSSLQKHGILVATITRMYPNLMVSEKDLEFFKEHIDPAMELAKADMKEAGLL